MSYPIPHSSVLDRGPDSAPPRTIIPDEVLELAPDVEPVPCSCCSGQKWEPMYGSAWGAGRPDLDFSYRPCVRCSATGEILTLAPDPLPASPLEGDAGTPALAA